ncbi:MAG TPA: M2 family metallopeptidase [Acidimicrobiia bacterium]|nr:M2 family metallopeptidase [Acidimicrobiia bacterium]
MTRSPEALVADLEAQLRPVETELAEAWWESNTRSSPAAEARRTEADLARRATLSDTTAFAELIEARASSIDDPQVRRQVEVLHDLFLPHQVPEDLRRTMVELETRVEATFNTFRGDLDGDRVDDNAILQILRASDDAALRRRAWEASKQVGAAVADDVRALARVRNEAARTLGYRDHFALSLATDELDEGRLFATLAEVDEHTADAFATWKRDLDATLASRFGCEADDLRPWHLDDPFFQDPPVAGSVDLDPMFEPVDLEAITLETYDGIGLDVRPVLERSDLHAREGKSQHAFCIDIDRTGDVRVLCNIEPNERWADTMLHEFGHAIYDREVSTDLPWLLRGPAHALTTEGVAMLFGRLVRDPQWLRDVVGVAPDSLAGIAEALAGARRSALLVFARWVLVMTHFEQRLYADPDGDLDMIWWDLVERFQLVRRPDGRAAPDWAAKVHLAVAPVYYQNYLYGELVASQLSASLTDRAGGIVGRPEAGRWLVEEFFSDGATRRWDDLVADATGEPLNARHLAAELGT